MPDIFLLLISNQFHLGSENWDFLYGMRYGLHWYIKECFFCWWKKRSISINEIKLLVSFCYIPTDFLTTVILVKDKCWNFQPHLWILLFLPSFLLIFASLTLNIYYESHTLLDWLGLHNESVFLTIKHHFVLLAIVNIQKSTMSATHQNLGFVSVFYFFPSVLHLG